MNYIKCPNQHYYDADVYPSCPQCNAGANYDRTTVTSGERKPTVTVDGDPKGGKTLAFWGKNKEEKTVAKENPFVVGWLVCTKGKNYGQAYNLKAGQNFIGREENMDVCIANEQTVSRFKHAIVIYEPVQNEFIALIGESSSLYYVNGSVVTSPVTLKKNDRLKIGDVELMLIPCCDESFTWFDLTEE